MPNKELDNLKQYLESTSGTHKTSIGLYRNDQPVFLHNEHKVTPTASMGKIFILLYLAEKISEGSINPNTKIEILPEDHVKDSGSLQHLSVQAATYNDLATLIASVSDNKATNTLIRTLGLTNIQNFTRNLGLKNTNILDRIRDLRIPKIHPPAPSYATAYEYAQTINMIQYGGHLDSTTTQRVKNWLHLNTDLSMVASTFNLDPLTQHTKLFNKTGTDTKIRCDAGNIQITKNSNYTYTVFTKFKPTKKNTIEAYKIMHEVGNLIIKLN